MDWGGTPYYKTWHDAPKYRTLKLSELLEKPEEIMKSKMYLKVNLDIDISYEEANFIKETFFQEYDIREMSLIQEKVSINTTTDDIADADFESVDQIVTEQLVGIESEAFDTKLLLEIYQDL